MNEFDPKNNEIATRRAFWVAIIYTIVAALSVGLSIFLIMDFPIWQVYVMAATTLVSLALDLASVTLLRRGQPTQALRILYWSSLVSLPINCLIFSGVTSFLIPMVLVVGFINVFYLFPKSWRKWYQFGPIIATILMLAVDYINPPFRVNLSNTSGAFGPVMVGFIIVSTIAIFLRLAWNAGEIRFSLRMTTVALIIVIPVIIGTSYFLILQAGNIIEQQGYDQLQKAEQAISGNVAIWLSQQAQTLNTMVSMPDIASMDAVKQVPILKTFGEGYSQIYLAHTMDLSGLNVARSDGGELRDYSDRAYFSGPITGKPIVYQSLISRTTGQPAVCIGSPIHNQVGNLEGVGSICTELTEISQGVQIGKIGETGFTFVVDEKNQVVAHPDPAFTAELSDFSAYPPVAMLRSGQNGLVSFTDDDGQQWHAFVEELDNGWGVIAQQNDSEQLATLNSFRVISLVALVIGVVIIAVAIWFAVQRATRPVVDLTQTAEAISAGDLTRKAKEGRRDEFGVLAKTFNIMTTQIRQSLAGLEERVAARTRDLELAAEVGQRLSLVRDPDAMLNEAVELIRERFGLYYTQIYLIDPTARALVLQAGTGEVGTTLLRRNHRLPVDLGSLNGTAVVERRSVIVENTETSSIHRPNPLLPDTRSEMVVPLISGDRVLGVLDMQSAQPGALSEENLAAFEALAGQLAITILNANLFLETERARAEVESQTRRLAHSGWHDYLDAIQRKERLGYRFENATFIPLGESPVEDPGESILVVPIQVSGEPVGSFQFKADHPWSEDDTLTAEAISHQVAQQIENLRLLAQAEQYQEQAQEALRRLTRESWESAEDESVETGYRYHDYMVQPVLQDASDGNVKIFPLNVHQEMIGEIAVEGEDDLSQEDQELVNAISQQLGTHLESLRLSHQTEKALFVSEEQAKHLAALNELSEQITQADDLKGILDISAQFLNRIVPSDRTSITWPTQDGKFLEVYALQGESGAIPTGAKLPLEGTAVGQSFIHRQVVIVPNLAESNYKENAQLAQQGLHSTMTVPLFTVERTLGTINFGSEDLNSYDNRYRDLAIQTASLISSAIENRELLQQTQRRAQREQALRQLTAAVRSSTDPATIMRTAVRELGDILGRKTMIRLDLQNESSESESDMV